MLGQKVVENPGLVVGRVVSPHKGRTHGGLAHLIGVHGLFLSPLPPASGAA